MLFFWPDYTTALRNVEREARNALKDRQMIIDGLTENIEQLELQRDEAVIAGDTRRVASIDSRLAEQRDRLAEQEEIRDTGEGAEYARVAGAVHGRGLGHDRLGRSSGASGRRFDHGGSTSALV